MKHTNSYMVPPLEMLGTKDAVNVNVTNMKYNEDGSVYGWGAMREKEEQEFHERMSKTGWVPDPDNSDTYLNPIIARAGKLEMDLSITENSLEKQLKEKYFELHDIIEDILRVEDYVWSAKKSDEEFLEHMKKRDQEHQKQLLCCRGFDEALTILGLQEKFWKAYQEERL